MNQILFVLIIFGMFLGILGLITGLEWLGTRKIKDKDEFGNDRD